MRGTTTWLGRPQDILGNCKTELFIIIEMSQIDFKFQEFTVKSS
jgi:hypothetical protein